MIVKHRMAVLLLCKQENSIFSTVVYTLLGLHFSKCLSLKVFDIKSAQDDSGFSCVPVVLFLIAEYRIKCC